MGFRIDWNTEGRTLSDPCISNVIDLLCSSLAHSFTLNKMQHLADKDVIKVTWFHKMITQAPES
jgi:hypothetical protein